MANWGNSKGTAGDKPNFKFLTAGNVTGHTAADGKPAGAQHVGWVNTVATGSGPITEITVDAAGTEYTEASVVIEGAGRGAKAVAVIDDGAIDSIVVTEPGESYVEGTTTVTIVGDGSGAEASATVVNRVKRETIVSFGSMVA